MPLAVLDPRLRVLYLCAVALGMFAVRDARIIAPLVVAQVAVAAWAAVPPARMIAIARRLLPFGVALALTFAFFPGEETQDRVMVAPGVRFSLGGLALAGLMLLRLFAVVLASEVARGSDPRAFATGLRGLGAPAALATSLDVTLGLLAADERRGGRGMGTGQGRRHRERAGSGGGLRAFLGALARGDVGPLVGELREKLHAATREAERRSDLPRGLTARDLGVIAGIASAMLALKLLKVLPGIPFAPGHKGVILIPLYILAGALTRMRWGATLTGATMGTIAFLMGDGRYGVFEILKHVAPGVIVDLLLPLFRRGDREPGLAAWCVFGLLVSLGRFAAVVAITLLAGAPGEMWALLAVPAVVHLVFGVLSGFVTWHVMRVADELAAEESPAGGAAPPEPRRHNQRGSRA